MLDQITPLILTYNEEPNIGRVLERLTWAREVVVLDSGSTDRTREIALSFANVRWESRAFDDFASQCNYSLDHLLPKGGWVLSLDSDYVLPPGWETEINNVTPDRTVKGYKYSFLYCVNGKPLRGTLYPARVCLFNNSKAARYVQDGHAHRLDLDGGILSLSAKILHDDRKPLSRWLVSQSKYADQEAELILSEPWGKLRWSNRIRKFLVLAPILAPLVYLFLKGGILDGRPGLYYAIQRMLAEGIISLKLLERCFSKENPIQ